jgi:HEAT repeat protein
MLGRSGNRGWVPALEKLLQNDEDPKVRTAAADSIARLGGENASLALLAAYNDSSDLVRFNVLWGLAEHRVNAAGPLAIWSLGDSSAKVRKHARTRLGSQHGAPKEMLQSFERFMIKRRGAPMPEISVAGTIGDSNSITLTDQVALPLPYVMPILHEALASPDLWVRAAALRFSRLCGVFRGSHLDSYLAATRDHDQRVRLEATATLGHYCLTSPLPESRAIEAMASLSLDQNHRVSELATKVIADLPQHSAPA